MSKLILNYENRINNFVIKMAEKPIIVKKERDKYQTTRQELLAKTADKILSKKGFSFKSYKSDKDRINEMLKVKASLDKYLEEIDKIKKKQEIKKKLKEVKFIQPSMRFRARNDLERVCDVIRNRDNIFDDKKLMNNQNDKMSDISYDYDVSDSSENNINKNKIEEKNLTEEDKKFITNCLEIKKTKSETERLEKKIEMIKKMDQKTKKYNDQSKEQNNNIKEAIEATKERLKEEEYTKKTLISTLQKIKKDIIIDERTLQSKYEKQNILKQKYHKEKLLENEIKEKQNQIYNQILKQKQKNSYDKNEFDLQIQYYNTIIEQKMMFIKSADERKERQAKIAQEAKKGSGDKEEIERRRSLLLLNLMNVYLQKKMETQIEKNKEIEDAFSKIKLICGTSNLKTMIDKILLKDKQYNYTVKRINEQEKKKKILIKEIQELQKQFEELKNEIVIDEDTVDKRNIQVVKSKDFETSIDYEKLVERNRNTQNKKKKPVAEKLVNKLKKFPLTKKYCKKNKNGKYESPSCCICLTEIQKGEETVLLPCGHMFHWKCCLNWLNENNTCPMCRFEIK